MGPISILTPCASPGVAIGNDALGMLDALQSSGYEACLYSGDCNSHGSRKIRHLEAYRTGAMSSHEGILIYHHAIGWPSGERLLWLTKNTIVVRFHNVTPETFFAGYSDRYVVACKEGEMATRRFARSQSVWHWADSAYNRDELIDRGALPSHCAVLPPFHVIEQMAEGPVDRSVSNWLDGDGPKLLCVSALKPHKGHCRALRILSHFCRLYDARTRLVIAGSSDEHLSTYVQTLRSMAAEYGVADNVLIAQDLSSAQVLGLYLSADVLLCVSDHEGFGVPLVEAMYFGVPVVGFGRTAIPETLGDAGVVLYEDDEASFAAAVREVVRNPKRANAVAEAGRRRYRTNFQPRVLRRQLVALIEELGITCNSHRTCSRPA